MPILSKTIKYGTVFVIGYYLGAGGCSEYNKENKLEKKVMEDYHGRTNKPNEPAGIIPQRDTAGNKSR
jgi:hypothetical protein